MPSNDDGFSLVEILIAMLLLLMVLLAIAPMFVLASRATASAGDYGGAGAVAVERMELLTGTPFVNLIAGGNLSANVAGFFDASNPSYLVRWRITDNAAPATIKTLSVRVVARQSAIGRPKEVTLTGIKAQEE